MQRSGDILRRFWRDPEHQRGLRLAVLWTSWPVIVGPEAAELARPLGHNKTTLLLGVEDAVAMQEISFQTPRILQAANAFLGEPFFDKVRLDLLGGRTSLDAIAGSLLDRRKLAPLSPEGIGQKLQGLGNIRGGFSGIPALERCYRAYVRLYGGFQEKNSNQQLCNTGNEPKASQPDFLGGNNE